MAKSNRWLMGMGAALAVLVIVAIAASFIDGESAQYPEDTPEGITQRYLSAMVDGDLTAAYAYLSADLQSECTLTEWKRMTRMPTRYEDSQMLLQDVRFFGDTEARVSVDLNELRTPEPFDLTPREYTTRLEFNLELLDGESWRFSQVPWPTYRCPEPELDTRSDGIIEPKPAQ